MHDARTQLAGAALAQLAAAAQPMTQAASALAALVRHPEAPVDEVIAALRAGREWSAGGAGGSQVQIDLDSDDDGEPAGEPAETFETNAPGGPGKRLKVAGAPGPAAPPAAIARPPAPAAPRPAPAAPPPAAPSPAAAAPAATSPREKPPPPLVALIGQGTFIVRSCVLEDPWRCVRGSILATRWGKPLTAPPSSVWAFHWEGALAPRVAPPPDGAADAAAPPQSAAKATVDAMREIVNRAGGSGSEGPPHLVVFSYVPVDEMPAGSAALWQRINDTCKALDKFAHSLAPTPLLALVTVTSQSGDPAAAMWDFAQTALGVSADAAIHHFVGADRTREVPELFNLAAAALRPADFAELAPYVKEHLHQRYSNGRVAIPAPSGMRFHNAHDVLD